MKSQFELTIDTTAFNHLTGNASLFLYTSNGEPYDAYLLLDDDGTVDFERRFPSYGCTPNEERHGLTRCWKVPPAVRGSELHDKRILELLQRVHNGHSVEWDGNKNVGALDEDAVEASDELKILLGKMAVWEFCDVENWLSPTYVIDHLWIVGKSLRDVVADIIRDAFVQNILIAEESETIAEMLCEELLNKFEDDKTFKLTAEQSEALLKYVIALANLNGMGRNIRRRFKDA